MAAADQPTSFQYFTLGVAIVAAMLSAGSLTVSFLAYRAGGPKVRVHTFRLAPVTADKIEFLVRVTNSGRGPIDVRTFAIWHRLGGLSHIRSEEAVSGEALPHRLDGMSQREWRIVLSESIRSVRRLNTQGTHLVPTPYRRVRLVAVLGDSRVVKPRFFHAFKVVPAEPEVVPVEDPS